jgi:hypothetical protein
LARRSVTECAGILDIYNDLDLIDEEMSMKSRTVLLRVVDIITKMARVYPKLQAGSHAQT